MSKSILVKGANSFIKMNTLFFAQGKSRYAFRGIIKKDISSLKGLTEIVIKVFKPDYLRIDIKSDLSDKDVNCQKQTEKYIQLFNRRFKDQS